MTGFEELQPRDRMLAEGLRKGLRQREALLDLTVTSRLGAARARAVSVASHSERRWNWLYASGGVATAATLAVLLILRPPQIDTSPAPESAARAPHSEVIEVLTDDVDAELYEDLDLYRWLERERDGAA